MKREHNRNPWKGLWSPSTWQIFDNAQDERCPDEDETENYENFKGAQLRLRPRYWSTSILSRDAY